jgi:putative methionine-R-sulfoxide reductase with GAF domain
MRDYVSAMAHLRSLLSHDASLDARLRAVVAAYWTAFGFDRPGAGRGVSWCGFYRREASDEAGQEMTLICREPKPACSPIGLQGMCGRGWKDEAAYVVRDVRVLGPNYIACDPRDQSELVIPVWDARASGPEASRCWGVFDVDSYDIGSFDEGDARGAIAMMEVAGLCPASVAASVRVL